MAHELTHAFVCHLDLPLWLEEGLTQSIEDEARLPWSRFEPTTAVAREIREYWRGAGLQDFWWGRGFTLPDEGQRFSYQLSQILIRLLMQDHRRSLMDFVYDARRRADAGEAATNRHLPVTLNQLASTSLGAGDWNPTPPDAAMFADRAKYRIACGERSLSRDDIERAIAHDPQLAAPYELRAHLWIEQGQHADAVADLSRAVRLNPRSITAMNSLAWWLATCPLADVRNGKKAVELAEKANEFTDYSEPAYLETLAAAYAEAGAFADAIRIQEHVVAQCPEDCREVSLGRLQLYREAKPYRSP